MGVASVTLMFAISIPAFGVEIYWHTLPAAIFTIILGAVSLAAVGLAVAGFVRRADAAPVVANLTLLPLSFISGVFYPIDKEPEWLQQIANIFPSATWPRPSLRVSIRPPPVAGLHQEIWRCWRCGR